MNKRAIVTFWCLLLMINLSFANEIVQTIRGTVSDKITKTPLIGANVVLLNSEPLRGVATDVNGNFRIEKVPVGRVGLKVTFLGYKEVVLQNLILNSAKELVVNIEMEEMVYTGQEVEIVAKQEKTETNNKMSTVSARLFTIEETERYAGSRGDPARMAMNYAGVSGANDQRNDIIIRGNSPSGLLWKIEDIEVPNPNHFAAQGSTGGPVSMLNNNTLSNSDFFTGAFPAEYGNALSGVFDLKMRNGNNEKHEFMGQIGFNGFELGAEGPIIRKNRSSYLINARYTTLGMMDKMGMNVGTTGIPYYQDLSAKFNFPLKNGVISLFSVAGKSHIAMLDSKQDTIDLYSGENQDLYNGSDLIVSGLSYTTFHNKNAYSKFIVSGFFENANTHIDTLDLDKNPHLFYKDDASNHRASFNYYYNQKISAKLSTRSGFNYDRVAFSVKSKYYSFEKAKFVELFENHNDLATGNNVIKAFNQWSYKFNDNLTVNPGFHAMYFDLPKKFAIEPRLGFNWQIAANQKISAGYGLHSRLQPILTYYFKTMNDAGEYVKSNQSLDFSKAHHAIIGYDINITEFFRLKTETYYQYLFNIPIENKATSYSILNTGAGWGVDLRDSLVNKGTGKNYGLEITAERFFHKGFYFLFTGSLFESKYKGGDGIERNTIFNGNFVINGLLGKEFKVASNKCLSFDIKSTYAGGRRYTPIDIEKSKQQSSLIMSTVFIDEQAFSLQHPNYFKTDVKVSYKVNGKKVTQEWQLYVENVTNHKNVLMQVYSASKQDIETIYQLGPFPMMNWRIYF